MVKNKDTVSANVFLEKVICVPNICQYPSLPTGCESAAASMLLKYLGYEIIAEDFAKILLKKGNLYSLGGKLYGPDPNKMFIGDPFTCEGYGCYASSIASSINESNIGILAVKITDKSLEELSKIYIDNNIPLMIWATSGMKESKKGRSWFLEGGEKFTWISGEHCLVLVGYNEDHYFLNDPQSGSTVAYEKELVEKRFKELHFQALYLYINED